MPLSIALTSVEGNNAALRRNGKGETAMPVSSPRARKVRRPRMSARDKEFENLLRRAADFFKSRPTPAVKTLVKNH